MKKIRIAAFLAVLLVVLCSCGNAAPETITPLSSNAETAPAESALPDIWKAALYTENTEMGEGEKSLSLTVEADGHSVVFTLHTDADTVGAALTEAKLVEGENGPFGLYIKKANGMLADYDIDGTYWSFLHGGEFLMTGVDTTPLKGDDAFELVLVR